MSKNKELKDADATLRLKKWYNKHINDELDSQKYQFYFSDLDARPCQYKNGIFRYFDIELKSYAFNRNKMQENTFKMFDGIGKYVDGKRINGNIVQYWGYHLLQCNYSDPDDSDLILWNGDQITLGELFQICRFERSPEFKKNLRNIGPKYW